MENGNQRNQVKNLQVTENAEKVVKKHYVLKALIPFAIFAGIIYMSNQSGTGYPDITTPALIGATLGLSYRLRKQSKANNQNNNNQNK